MIQNVPGGAIFEAPGGSAAARPNPATPRPAAEAAAAGDRTSAAQDATRTDERARPAAQTAGSERTTDDAARGGKVDISV